MITKNRLARRENFQSLVISLCIFVLICTGCGGSDGEDPVSGPHAPIPDVVLESSSGSAASILKVSGLDIESCPLGTSEIRIGGQTAPALLNDNGEVVMMLPLFYDEATGWMNPPSRPQDVEIYCNGSLLTTLTDAITVTGLDPSPGKTAAIIEDYTHIISDFKELAAILAPNPGIQQQLLTSLLGAMGELLSGPGEHSLSAILGRLKQNHPEELAVLDAIHAAAGLDDTASDFRDMLAELKTSAIAVQSPVGDHFQTAPVLPAKTILSLQDDFLAADSPNNTDEPIVYRDDMLAFEMRLYATLKLFSEQVLSNTAVRFSLAAGAASIFINKIPYLTAVDLTLYALDFIFKTVVVSSFPAVLESIELTLAKTILENSEITESNFIIRAKSIPEPVTLSDVFTAAINTLGIGGLGDDALVWVKNSKERLQRIVLSVTAGIDKFFQDYAAANPKVIAHDMDLFSIVPPMYFIAEGATGDLYTLLPYPSESTVVLPLTERLEWQASASYSGRDTVFIETRPGSFGNEMATSNKVPVTVGDLAFVFDRNSVIIPEGESMFMRVKLSDSPPGNQEMRVHAAHSSGDADISVISVLPLIFNKSNWDDYQVIVLTAAEDADKINGVAFITVSSNDIADWEIAAIERDNDTINFVTNDDTFTIIEGVSSYTGLKVKLNNMPPSPVSTTITHAGGDEDIVVESEDVLVFNDSNWNTYQTVILAAMQDDDNELGKATFKISTDTPNIEDKFITVEEHELNRVSLAVEMATSRHNFPHEGNYLYDEIVGIIPLDMECGSDGLGSVRGTAILPYNGFGVELPYYDHDKGEFAVCTVDMIGTAHISVEGTIFACAEDPGLLLNLVAQVEYIHTIKCPSAPVSSTSNIDEYDGRILLSIQNNYQYELNEDWEEGNLFGNDYFFVEILDPDSP